MATACTETGALHARGASPRRRDARTGAALTSYKSNASPCNGLSLMGRDYLVAAQAKKGALHFWTWHKASAARARRPHLL